MTRWAVAPSGSLAVGIGLTVLGLTSFAFLTLSGRALGPDRFGALALFWMLLHTLGPGLFLPLEQELARSITSRAASGQGSRDVVCQAVKLGLLLTLLLLLVISLLGPFLVRALFDGSIGLLIALLAGMAAMAGSYLLRGLLAGVQAWGRYGLQLGSDGVLRLLAVLALAGFGSQSPSSYAFALVLAAALSVVVLAAQPCRRLQSGPSPTWGDLSSALGWLLTGSIGSLLLLNAGPIAVQLLASPEESAAAGNFVAALVLARVPLFMFAAVQAALLPTLTRWVTEDSPRRYLRALRNLSVAVLVIAMAGVGACVLAGPELLETVFGDDFRTDRVDLVLLAGSTAGFMLMTVLGQALIAMRCYAAAAVGPLLGSGTFLLGCAVAQGSLSRRVALALAVAVAVAVTALAGLLYRRVHRWVGAHAR